MNKNSLNLLVGLGNPGSKFKETRHNVGFMVLQKYASNENTKFFKAKKLFGELAELGVGKDKKRLLMPNTFMNDSGKSIKSTLQWFDIGINQLLILVDDMDLPLGTFRLRRKGGSGGHKGLQSTILHLGTENFCRLRIGIGAPSNDFNERRIKTNSYVLGKFSSEETKIVKKVIDKIIYCLKLIDEHGLDIATNEINSSKNNPIF